MAEWFIAVFQISVRRACKLVGSHRSVHYYRSRAEDQTALRLRIRDIATARVRYGYHRIWALLRREGWHVNTKRVYRLYKLEGLSLRLKCRRKRVSRQRVTGPPASAPNECWSMDFVSDSLASGSRFRALTIVDNFTRESRAIEAGFSMTGKRVAEVLERLALGGELPRRIKVDNGSEFISRALDEWAYRRGVKLEFSRPGKPTDNAFIESFNGRLRQECLNARWFASLDEARQVLENWRKDYNEVRPHTALGMLAPQVFRNSWQQIGAG